MNVLSYEDGPVTNIELMLKYIAGDAAAFDELFDRIHQRVYSFVRKHLSDTNEREDVTQNIFIKLHTTKERFNPEYPFEAWLFTIARSVLYDHLRKSSKIKMEEFKEFLQINEEDPIDLTPYLNLLPEKNRKVIEMRYLDEMTFDEIARDIDTSAANIRQIITRTIKLLKKNKEVLSGK
ncbi:MAG: RNA polymerase sigma factor [Bacteriovoracaceae bacterium]